MMNITRVAGPKHCSSSDAISEIKRQLNTRILRFAERGMHTGTGMASKLQTTEETWQRLRSFQLDGYTIDDMVMFLMRLGLYSVQVVQSEVPELSIQFSKAH